MCECVRCVIRQIQTHWKRVCWLGEFQASFSFLSFSSIFCVASCWVLFLSFFLLSFFLFFDFSLCVCVCWGFLLFIWLLLLLARLHHHYQYANKPRAAAGAAAAAAANDNWSPLISTNRICVGAFHWPVLFSFFSFFFSHGMLAILYRVATLISIDMICRSWPGRPPFCWLDLGSFADAVGMLLRILEGS